MKRKESLDRILLGGGLAWVSLSQESRKRFPEWYRKLFRRIMDPSTLQELGTVHGVAIYGEDLMQAPRAK